MKIFKVITFLVLCLVFVFSADLTLAQSTATRAADNKSMKMEERLNKVKGAIKAHVALLNRMTDRAASILDQIQTRIDRAKNNGQDVTQLNSLMSDARAKLSDAKTKLTQISPKIDAASKKADFQALKPTYKAISEDLHVLRKDVAQMRTILKGYNSSTKSATPSAKP